MVSQSRLWIVKVETAKELPPQGSVHKCCPLIFVSTDRNYERYKGNKNNSGHSEHREYTAGAFWRKSSLITPYSLK